MRYRPYFDESTRYTLGDVVEYFAHAQFGTLATVTITSGPLAGERIALTLDRIEVAS